MFKRVRISDSVWNNGFYKTFFHFEEDGLIKCGFKCNGNGAECSLFKFDKLSSTCEIAKAKSDIDWRNPGEENTLVHVKKEYRGEIFG